MAIAVADDMASCAAEDTICVSLVDRLNTLDVSDKTITVEKGKLRWNDNLESLKYLLKQLSIYRDSIWRSKMFKGASGGIIVKFHADSASLLFQGDEGETINNILIGKIVGNLEYDLDKGESSNCASYEETLLCELINTNILSVDFANNPSNNSMEYPYSGTDCDSSVLAVEIKSDANKLAKIDIACQTRGEEIDETQTLHINQDNLSQQISTNIKNLKATTNKLESTVQSLESAIKDHDAILSLYNNAVDLNAEYLKRNK